MEIPRATFHRWVSGSGGGRGARTARKRPVAEDHGLVEKVRELCSRERHATYGHRRIRALLLKEEGLRVNRKTVLAIMHALGLTQERLRWKAARPRRIERMAPDAPNRAWQIDMTSFALSDLTPLFLIVVIDCCTRKIVGWSLDRRCRAKEWVSALRTALDCQGLGDREQLSSLVLRSDNGAQPCSKHFVETLGHLGIRSQYTGYNAPDDNAFVERVIRTIKEEEIWPNSFDMWSEAHAAIDDYVRFYNNNRIHSALDYRTPIEAEAACLSPKAA